MAVNYNFACHRREDFSVAIRWRLPYDETQDMSQQGFSPFFTLYDDLNNIVFQANTANARIVITAPFIYIYIYTQTLVTLIPGAYSYNLIVDGPSRSYELLSGIFILRY